MVGTLRVSILCGVSWRQDTIHDLESVTMQIMSEVGYHLCGGLDMRQVSHIINDLQSRQPIRRWKRYGIFRTPENVVRD